MYHVLHNSANDAHATSRCKATPAIRHIQLEQCTCYDPAFLSIVSGSDIYDNDRCRRCRHSFLTIPSHIRGAHPTSAKKFFVFVGIV